MKLFTASFYKTNKLIPEFDFDDIDELVELVNEIQEHDDDDDDDEFDVDGIEITFNTGVEFEKDGVIEFLSKFDELEYDLMVAVGEGEYDQYWEDEGREFYQFQYLVSDRSMSAEDALEKYDEVGIYEGSREGYAEQYMSDVYDIPDNLQNYIDYDKFANDLERDGCITEFMDDVWITNGNQF